jgi:serine/threonine protein phosphatase PrpC
MQGWRKNMEDAHLCLPNIGDDVALFGVFDGHGGN